MRRVTPEPFQALLNNLDTSAQEKNPKQTMSTYTEEETSFPSMAVAISLSLSLIDGSRSMHATSDGGTNSLGTIRFICRFYSSTNNCGMVTLYASGASISTKMAGASSMTNIGRTRHDTALVVVLWQTGSVLSRFDTVLHVVPLSTLNHLSDFFHTCDSFAKTTGHILV